MKKWRLQKMNKNMRYLILSALCLLASCSNEKRITVVSESTSPRIVWGTTKLVTFLKANDYIVTESKSIADDVTNQVIIIKEERNGNNPRNEEAPEKKSIKEGFRISSKDNRIYIEGTDSSGALYGILELISRIEEEETIPTGIDFSDRPEMVLRGTCIGLQKPEYLPGRTVYEYPYTPENFPWFYDKELWVDYLDMMVENRLNSLYLWNGHPFASLVKLEDYPYAVEVSDETFKKNEEIFRFLSEEADKRGIWVIQMFYNIIVSKPFAEHHQIKTQDRQRPIIPVIADYTRKSVAAFIEKYPNVGLLVALGEAMSGKENDIEWFTQTIIPGVKDGLKASGRTDEPPIILRAHDTDAPLVMEHALPIYKNLYTTHKYNGESLTTYEPRGPWSEIHKNLSSLGSIHISNVHILANLEPFRYGSPDFIQKSVQAMHNVHGANALHLYPQASYWDWPYTADKTEPRLLQIDRDWIWYKAWARYAWKADRDKQKETEYWAQQLAYKYGSDLDAGGQIVTAYEESGEIAPKTLRRFGITEGNRQTLLLGMFESQLVNPYKWRVYPGFYESCGPVGEILLQYAEKEWKGLPHEGETPLQIINEITKHGEIAVQAIEKASSHVSLNLKEFERLKNDIYAYRAFANFFSEKVKAAISVLRYSYSNKLTDLDTALPHLIKSIEHYEELVELTKDHYLYANSMQTAQRRIPIGGDNGKNKTWEEMLPHYQRELSNFKRNLNRLKASDNGQVKKEIVTPWQTATVEFLGTKPKSFKVQSGKSAYVDEISQIHKLAPELKNLTGLGFMAKEQIENGTQLRFKTTKPVKLVVGYFNTDLKRFLLPPSLETNAAGNMQGEAEVVLANAMKLTNLPRVNIHTYEFGIGEHLFSLEKGRVLLLGFIDAGQIITSRDVGFIEEGEKEAVDWLFY
ncbi:hypothetical protein C7972_10161 [Arenibacter sp. ARW7G5Y1]|nr:hypothetical protein C7972_10161 [Arenibacter sp. ARW7G5Y1]